MSALLGGVYAASSHQQPERVADALRFALHAPWRDAVAPMTGAMLGALHGVAALPMRWLSRLRLGWVLDLLAGDLLAQLVLTPGGGEYQPVLSADWSTRYPPG